MQLSNYSLERLRDDGEFILYRAHGKPIELASVLLLAPASTRPSPETLNKIDHEYSLRGELNSAWAVRPLALAERSGQKTLVLEDPGGETLDGFISGAMELTELLRFVVALATALGGLHERKLSFGILVQMDYFRMVDSGSPATAMKRSPAASE